MIFSLSENTGVPSEIDSENFPAIYGDPEEKNVTAKSSDQINQLMV